MIGPTPKISGSVVADAVTASAIRALERFHLAVQDMDVVEQFLGELEALTLRRGDRVDRREEAFGLRNDHFLADPTGDELVHQRMQATARPRPCAAGVEVRLGQQPQHTHVVLTTHGL